MKQLIKKIGAVFMTLVMLFSTMSFTISNHYCGDILVDSALFSEAASCGMDGMEIQKPAYTKDHSFHKDNCCHNEIKQIEGQREIITQVLNLDFEQQIFLASFVYTYINLFEGLDTNIVPFKEYSPPIIDKDINVLYQTFLI